MKHIKKILTALFIATSCSALGQAKILPLDIKLTSAKIILGDGSNRGAAVSISGDASIDNTGQLTLSNNPTTLSHLGANLLGRNLFTITNASATSYIRINSDNSVSLIDASTLASEIGAGGSGAPVYPDREIVYGDGTTAGGTTSNQFTFIDGDFRVDHNSSDSYMKFEPVTNKSFHVGFDDGNSDLRLDQANDIINFNTNNLQQIYSQGTDMRLMANGGTVSINTWEPIERLTVQGNVQIGSPLSGDGSEEPLFLSVGRTYGTNTVGNAGNTKIKLYDDGDPSNSYGLGISEGLMEFRSGQGADVAIFTDDGNYEAMRWQNDGRTKLTTTPDISSGSYNFLTLNTSTSVIERVAGSFITASDTASMLSHYPENSEAVLKSSLGTGVNTALGVNTGTSGAFVVNGGVLGTPSSGILTNATGLPYTTGLIGGGTNTLLYTSAANTFTSLTTANSSVLTTTSGGAPQWTAQGTAFNKSYGTSTTSIPEIGSTLGNTKALGTNSSGQLVTRELPSYMLTIGTSEGTPVAATTYYFGNPVAAPLNTASNTKRVYIPRTGTIKKIYITVWVRGTAGTAGQTITIDFNVNNGGSYTTVATSDLNAAGKTTIFSNTSLSTSVSAGDYLEFRFPTPNPWTTPATNINISGHIEIEYSN